MRIGVVLLYGVYTGRQADWAKYYDFVISEIEKEKLDKVFLCGGKTNAKFPELSESRSVYEYMRTKTAFSNFELEEDSLTTNQNMELIANKIGLTDEIVVYGDVLRKAKIICIAMKEFLKAGQTEIVRQIVNFGYEKDVHKDFEYGRLKVKSYYFSGRSFEELIGQTYATIWDVMSIWDKEIEELVIKKRKEDFGLK